MTENWLLLVYTVPSTPSSKRAFVWREVKKVGAVLLRDGVAVLPEKPDTVDALRAIAAKVEMLGGQATLVEGASLGSERASAVIARSQADRAAEYGEFARQAQQVLDYIQVETEHRKFTSRELQELEADIGKLTHWADRIDARDYFGAAESGLASELLGRCRAALAALVNKSVAMERSGR